MTPALLLLLLVSACGWPPPPDTISISSDFTEVERAQIDDALDQWCVAVAFCPRVVASGAEGRIIPGDAHDLGSTRVDSDGRPYVVLDTRKLRKRPGAFWTVVAHEIGHFGCDHFGDGGLMRPFFQSPESEPHCVDDGAVSMWCGAQSCDYTAGTC
jgi:hypothetical protein